MLIGISSVVNDNLVSIHQVVLIRSTLPFKSITTTCVLKVGRTRRPCSEIVATPWFAISGSTAIV